MVECFSTQSKSLQKRIERHSLHLNNCYYTKIVMNRPEKRNALDQLLLEELYKAIIESARLPDMRAIVLTGRGSSFCAGLDISTLGDPAISIALQRTLYALHHSSLPVISLCQGEIYGGGIGLLAASDIVIADPNTTFTFTEGCLGVLPALITPYVLQKCGLSRTKAWMVSSVRFTAQEAFAAGLVHEIIPADTSSKQAPYARWLKAIQNTAPSTASRLKDFFDSLLALSSEADQEKFCVETFTQMTEHPDAKKGVQAFLNKTRPSWAAT